MENTSDTAATCPTCDVIRRGFVGSDLPQEKIDTLVRLAHEMREEAK